MFNYLTDKILFKLILILPIIIMQSSAFADILYDDVGLYKEKYIVCESFDLIKEAHIDIIKAKLVGLKAKSKNWDVMEIYANEKTGAWVLLGKKIDKNDPDLVCVLADEEKKPYIKEKWYELYFKNKGAR